MEQENAKQAENQVESQAVYDSGKESDDESENQSDNQLELQRSRTDGELPELEPILQDLPSLYVAPILTYDLIIPSTLGKPYNSSKPCEEKTNCDEAIFYTKPFTVPENSYPYEG